jgi:hypothetical protein
MQNKQNITVCGNKVGVVSKAASCRHCEEERRSNPVIISYFWIASFLAMTGQGFRDTPRLHQTSLRVYIRRACASTSNEPARLYQTSLRVCIRRACASTSDEPARLHQTSLRVCIRRACASTGSWDENEIFKTGICYLFHASKFRS